MMGESDEVRYKVHLMATTKGSAAAASTKSWVEVAKDWYG
jgi:hypothetical protein